MHERNAYHAQACSVGMQVAGFPTAQAANAPVICEAAKALPTAALHRAEWLSKCCLCLLAELGALCHWIPSHCHQVPAVA